MQVGGRGADGEEKSRERERERGGQPKKEIRIYLFTLRGRARLREMERRQLDKLLPHPSPVRVFAKINHPAGYRVTFAPSCLLIARFSAN